MPEVIETDATPTMSQRSFASAEFALKKKRTRREKFLAEMERVVPRARLIAVIEPLYPTSGRVGRQPMGVPKMLRMYLLQQWYGLAEEALEDAIYDSQALRDFVGIDLSRESEPDATTLLKFRRLLLAGDLTKAMFEEINAHLQQQGLLMPASTTVDATIIAAPSSTKNSSGERGPKMHQAKKSNQWHFGMKAHIAVDAASGIVHSMITTAANVNDVTQAGALLHGHPKAVARGLMGVRRPTPHIGVLTSPVALLTRRSQRSIVKLLTDAETALSRSYKARKVLPTTSRQLGWIPEVIGL